MKYTHFFMLCAFVYTNCAFVDSTKLFSLQHGIGDGASSKQPVLETLNKDTTQFIEFVQIFFADSVYQRKHVCFPLVLSYWTEQDPYNNSTVKQNIILMNDNNSQILMLDVRSEVKIIEDKSMEPYVVVSIPDTALEAKLYFKKIMTRIS